MRRVEPVVRMRGRAPVVTIGRISSGGLASFFGADSCSSKFFSFSLSFSRFPGFRSLMSSDKFLHNTSISNFKFSYREKMSLNTEICSIFGCLQR